MQEIIAQNFVTPNITDYVHPNEVVRDDRLSRAEKRAILSAWASDACAVESRPGFRWLPGTPGPILVDHVLDALHALDASQTMWAAQANVMSPVLARRMPPSAVASPHGR